MPANDARITALAERLKGRLDPGLLDFAVSYVKAGEPAIAVETITSWLCEGDVAITRDELTDILELQVKCHVSPDHALIDALHNLVRTRPAS